MNVAYFNTFPLLLGIDIICVCDIICADQKFRTLNPMKPTIVSILSAQLASWGEGRSTFEIEAKEMQVFLESSDPDINFTNRGHDNGDGTFFYECTYKGRVFRCTTRSLLE